MPLVSIKPAAGTLTEKQRCDMAASGAAVLVAFAGCVSA
jgi:phenylpyruvate tautomerase PptA (4-oxalocrotonate tautomerase family)